MTPVPFPTSGRPTITLAQIHYATDCYYKSNRRQRMGQFLINTFMTTDTVWPELWYEGDIPKCVLWFQRYLESLEISGEP